MTSRQRAEGAGAVCTKLAELLPQNADVVILAGVRYREHVEPFLRRHGMRVEIPLEGLKIGYQLAWLSRR